jgi:monovalent cation:H+ antiporter-2, CPA2 family
LRAGTALVACGRFSIVIAGPAVTSGVPEIGPVATGYVLILAVTGPVLTRVVEPLRTRLVSAPATG